MIRRVVAAAASLVLFGAFAVVAAAPADAAAYRFWSYWKGGSGSWVFSQIGAGVRLTDGAVEGWRFAVSPDSAHALTPRFDAANAFASQCGSVPADPSKIRIAVVVDYGTAEHAPQGQSPPGGPTGWCAVLPADPRPTGFDALAYSTTYRQEGGLLCGITGYPTGECGVVVADPAAPPPPPATPAPTPPAVVLPNPPAAMGTAPSSSTAPSPKTSSSPGQLSSSSSPGAPFASGSTAPVDTSQSLTPSASDASPSPSESLDPSSEQERMSLAPVPVARHDDDGGGTPLGVLIGGALVAGLGAAAVWQMRRRRSTP